MDKMGVKFVSLYISQGIEITEYFRFIFVWKT